jgi:transketolase
MRFPEHQDRPTLIIVDSHIGYGAPHKQDTSAAHGEPLGEEEVRLAKRAYGWPEDAKFLVPDGVREHFRAGWAGAAEAARRLDGALFANTRRISRSGRSDSTACSTASFRKAGTRTFPNSRPMRRAWPRAIRRQGAERRRAGTFLADRRRGRPRALHQDALTFEGAGDFEADEYGGRNLHFGIREHAMGAILNGLALSKIRASARRS